ncbi:MAG: cobalamin-dependent protein, partial [Leptospira sp.]|nr:cobalamin-dependent protein [Leptospira sp.]
MKVALVGLPTKNVGNQFPNAGVLLIAQYIRAGGHDVHVIDAVRYGLSVDSVAQRLKSLKPDLIGLSGIITAYHYFEPLALLLKKILPNTPVVLGGGITCVLDVIEKHTEIEYVIKGEGEHVMMSLIRLLETNQNLQDHDVPGLLVRAGDVFKHPSIEQEYPDISDSLYPAYELYDMDYYIESSTKNAYRFLEIYPEIKKRVGDGVKFFSVNITRGCPYKCTFCYRFVKKFRHPSIANAVGHLKMI